MHNENDLDLGAADHENLPDPAVTDSGPLKLKPPKAKTGPKPKQLVEGTYQGLPVGRDKKVIDPQDVEKLAALGCTDRDIANWFGIDENTLRYNFSDNLIKGREELKISLRRSMLRTAHSGNAAVLIFLAKNILGMTDQPLNTDDKKPLPWTDD